MRTVRFSFLLLVLLFVSLPGAARADGPPPYPTICNDQEDYCQCLCNSGPHWARLMGCPYCGATGWFPTCVECVLHGEPPTVWWQCDTVATSGAGICQFMYDDCYGWGNCIHT